MLRRIDRYIERKNNDFLEIALQKIERVIELKNQELLSAALDIYKQVELELNARLFCSVGELYEYGEHIGSQHSLWMDCDIVFACSNTERAVKTFLNPNKVCVVNDGKHLAKFITQLQGKKFGRVGLISPYITGLLIANPSQLFRMIQLCSEELVVVIKSGLQCTPSTGYAMQRFSNFLPTYLEKEFRKTFHRAGIFEIVGPIRSDDDYGILSTGVLPDGGYTRESCDLGSGHSIGVFCTYRASRLAFINIPSPRWANVFGELHQDALGKCTGIKDQLSLAISLQKQCSEVKCISVKANLQWEAYRSGHASLVGAYGGPGDTNMYAALVQFANESSIGLSLWVNTGQWRLLKEAVVVDRRERGDSLPRTIPLWLKIDSSTVTAGTTGSKAVLSVADKSLARVPRGGIRLMGDAISLFDVSVDLV